MATDQELFVNAERGEVLLSLLGKPRRVRFGFKFLKTLSDRRRESGPAGVLEALQMADLGQLGDFVAVGLELAIPPAERPEGFDALDLLDEQPAAVVEALTRAMMKGLTANPMLAALKSEGAAPGADRLSAADEPPKPETWDDLEGFALGELRLKPKAFWRLTWREYLAIAGGHHRREVGRWQHTRFLASILLNVNRGENTPPIAPADVLWLPGDPPPAPPLDEETFDATMARLAAFDSLPPL